jgi:hypothetical protein
MNFQKLKTPQSEKTVLKDSSDNFRILDYPQLYHLWGTEVTIISNLPALLKQLNLEFLEDAISPFCTGVV